MEGKLYFLAPCFSCPYGYIADLFDLNVGKEIAELVTKGMTVVVCETCCAARGIHRGEEIKGTKIGSLTNDLSKFIKEGDKMITIAR